MSADPNSAGGGDVQVARAQRQVQEAMGNMRQNMQEMAQRDMQLQGLGEKTDAFANTSSQFAQSSKQLHHKMLMKKYFIPQYPSQSVARTQELNMPRQVALSASFGNKEAGRPLIVLSVRESVSCLCLQSYWVFADIM